MKKNFNLFIFYIILLCLLCGCPVPDQPTTEKADLVVYGSIYTAEDNIPNAEAFAIKNGKYIYVGDKAGAKKYIDKKTKVQDYTNNGMIMPGCTDSHSHFALAKTLELIESFNISETAEKNEILQNVQTGYNNAKAKEKKILFGNGWNNVVLSIKDDFPTRQDLDKISPDIPVYLADEEMHKAIVNTKALIEAEILNEDETAKITTIKGGEIMCDTSGDPNGILVEQAASYVRIRLKELANLVNKDLAKEAIVKTQEMLNNEGYVYYMDGWTNFFSETAFYEAAQALEKDKKLNMCIGLSYEFDSYVTDFGAEITKAKKLATQYSSSRINANYIKLFMDGTYGGLTAFTIKPYQYETKIPNGIYNWELESLKIVTKKANEQGLTIHVHTMGDAAVKRCLDAFESDGNKACRNTLVHIQKVQDSDFQRIKDNNVCCAVGILWHIMSDIAKEKINDFWPIDSLDNSYPIKSHLKLGTCVSSSSDYPALSGSPWEPFKIMKIAVTGQIDNEDPWDPTELCTREEMLKILTINGAYQLHIEKQRGSIKVGKYADFIYVDKDVFAKNTNDDYLVPNNSLNDVKVVNTYFEGRQVK